MDGLFDLKSIMRRATRRFVAPPRESWIDYAIAAASVTTAAALRAFVSLWLTTSPSFPIFYPAVLIAALLGGVRAGIFALVSSALVVWWIWSPLMHHLPLDRPETINLVIFVFTAGLLVAVAETARNASRRAVAAEEQFRVALESSLDAFAIMAPVRNPAGEVVDFVWTHSNAASDALAPRDARPLKGRRLLDVFPDAADRGLMARYLRLLATGQPDHYEFHRPIDGVDRWMRSTGVKIGDAVGLTFRDTTAAVESQRTLEARVAARTRELEQSQADRARTEQALAQAQRLETVGRLTGGVAHDFNNLLTVIVGGLDMILRAPDKVERVRRLAQNALEAGRRGERLTRQLLAFSRHQELKLEVAEVAPVLAEIEPLFRRAIREDLTLTIGVAENAGAARIDTAQFEAALLNLVVNAADATPSGGSIALRARQVRLRQGEIAGLAAGAYLAVSVSDTGAGMAPEVLDRVFEPFFTTKEVGKGTGLGLAQVYGFARQCGGLATIESEPGAGATVTLYLPSAGAATGEDAPTKPAAALKLPFAKGETVLLVEDDPDVRAVTETLLAEFGCRVLTAEDGPSALAVLEGGETLALLLSDVVMPGGMSGVDLAQAASRLRPQLPILLATGYAAGRLADITVGAAWPVLRKPFRMDDLAIAVRHALRTEKNVAHLA
jgi:signal transduction histidine kinase/ActR/RegA family two-component response regulator